jgi:hypothetical protein
VAKLRIHRLGVEVLQKTVPRTHTTRVDVEAFVQNVLNAAKLRIHRLGIEVLSVSPVIIGTTRVDVEAFVKNVSNAAKLRVHRIGIEVLSQSPIPIKTTRIDVEAFVKNVANSAKLRLQRIGLEVLAKTGPLLNWPRTGATDLEIFFHNWAAEINVSTAYMTDISMADETLSEERIGLLEKPLRTLELTWAGLERSEAFKMMNHLIVMTDSQMIMPLYSDFVKTNATTPALADYIRCDPSISRFTKNQRIVILKRGSGILPDPNFTPILREIATVQVDRLTLKTALPNQVFEANQYIIFPLLDVEKLQEPRLVLGPRGDVGTVQLTVQELPGNNTWPPFWTGLPPASSYNGYPIFDFEPNWIDEPEITFKREGSIEDKGRAFHTRFVGPRYRLKQEFTVGFEKDDFFRLLQFFDSRRGRGLAFWMVDHDYTNRFSAISGPGNQFIDLDVDGNFTDFQTNFDYVGIVLKDGTTLVRQAVSFSQIGGLFRITVDAALPDIEQGTVVRIAKARLSRFTSDELEEIWRTSNWMTSTLSTIEVLNEGEVQIT